MDHPPHIIIIDEPQNTFSNPTPLNINITKHTFNNIKLTDQYTFQKQYHLLTNHMLTNLDFSHTLLVGDVILYSSINYPSNIQTHDYYASKKLTIDIYFYDITPDDITNKIKNIYDTIKTNTLHPIEISGDHTNIYFKINNYIIKCYTNIYPTIKDVISSIKIDCCKVAYDGTNIHCSNLAIQSLSNQSFNINVTETSFEYFNNLLTHIDNFDLLINDLSYDNFNFKCYIQNETNDGLHYLIYHMISNQQSFVDKINQNYFTNYIPKLPKIEYPQKKVHYANTIDELIKCQCQIEDNLKLNPIDINHYLTSPKIIQHPINILPLTIIKNQYKLFTSEINKLKPSDIITIINKFNVLDLCYILNRNNFILFLLKKTENKIIHDPQNMIKLIKYTKYNIIHYFVEHGFSIDIPILYKNYYYTPLAYAIYCYKQIYDHDVNQLKTIKKIIIYLMNKGAKLEYHENKANDRVNDKSNDKVNNKVNDKVNDKVNNKVNDKVNNVNDKVNNMIHPIELILSYSSLWLYMVIMKYNKQIMNAKLENKMDNITYIPLLKFKNKYDEMLKNRYDNHEYIKLLENMDVIKNTFMYDELDKYYNIPNELNNLLISKDMYEKQYLELNRIKKLLEDNDITFAAKEPSEFKKNIKYDLTIGFISKTTDAVINENKGIYMDIFEKVWNQSKISLNVREVDIYNVKTNKTNRDIYDICCTVDNSEMLNYLIQNDTHVNINEIYNKLTYQSNKCLEYLIENHFVYDQENINKIIEIVMKHNNYILLMNLIVRLEEHFTNSKCEYHKTNQMENIIKICLENCVKNGNYIMLQYVIDISNKIYHIDVTKLKYPSNQSIMHLIMKYASSALNNNIFETDKTNKYTLHKCYPEKNTSDKYTPETYMLNETFDYTICAKIIVKLDENIIHQIDDNGQTPIYEINMSNNKNTHGKQITLPKQMLLFMIEHNIDIHHKNKDELTIVDHLIKNNVDKNIELVEMLYMYKSNDQCIIDSIIEAAKKNNYEIYNKLKNLVDDKIIDKYGNTYIHYFVSNYIDEGKHDLEQILNTCDSNDENYLGTSYYDILVAHLQKLLNDFTDNVQFVTINNIIKISKLIEKIHDPQTIDHHTDELLIINNPSDEPSIINKESQIISNPTNKHIHNSFITFNNI